MREQLRGWFAMNSRMTHGVGNKEFFKSAYPTAKTLAATITGALACEAIRKMRNNAGCTWLDK